MGATTYILAGSLIDGSGGPVQEKVLLKIVDGRFAAIDKYSPADGLDPALITDLSHCTILPPLVDSHVHLFMSGSTDKQTRERQLTAGYDELRPVIARHLQDLLRLASEASAALPLLASLLSPDRWLLWLGLLFVLSVYYFPTGVVGRLRTAALRKS